MRDRGLRRRSGIIISLASTARAALAHVQRRLQLDAGRAQFALEFARTEPHFVRNARRAVLVAEHFACPERLREPDPRVAEFASFGSLERVVLQTLEEFA